MNKIRIAKIAGIAAGATLAFGSFIPMVGAVTIAELQAQINALLAQLATLQGGTTTTTTACTFTRSLTMSSTGADVTCLQSYLVAQGHLVMPVGVAMGYFGSLTQAAVAKWQAANGVAPAVGYFGPISQARYTAVAGTTTGGTTTGGTTGGTTTGGTGITTPGVEGTITASVNPSPSTGTKLYESDSMRQVLGIKLEAKTSDIKIERIKLKIAENDTTSVSDTDFYRKIASKIYIMDGSTVLGSADLNVNTVVKDGTNYYITVSGLSFIVPKGTTKVLYAALDAMSAWDDTFNGDAWTLSIPVDGVRGIDGAGVNQYSPSTLFSRDFNSTGELADSATLAISLSSSSPNTNQVICEGATDNDECDELEIMKADFKAEKDAVTVTDMVLAITRTVADVATTTTAYLYDGSTLIGSATVVGTSATAATATFSDIDWVVPKDTTRTMTVKLDIRDSALAKQTFYVAITGAANVTAENTNGTAVVESGSATSKVLTIRKVGPEVTLISKSITQSGAPQNNGVTTNVSTSTLTATFNIKIKAVGGALTLGTVASGTPVMASTTSNSLTGGSFLIYRNGAADTSIASYSTSTSYSIPTTCVVSGNSCTLSEGSEVTVPVTFSILGRSSAGANGGIALTNGLYSVQFGGIQWWNATTGTVQTTDFMASETDWRTSDVSFP